MPMTYQSAGLLGEDYQDKANDTIEFGALRLGGRGVHQGRCTGIRRLYLALIWAASLRMISGLPL
jgi:hypothetical protein